MRFDAFAGAPSHRLLFRSKVRPGRCGAQQPGCPAVGRIPAGGRRRPRTSLEPRGLNAMLLVALTRTRTMPCSVGDCRRPTQPGDYVRSAPSAHQEFAVAESPARHLSRSLTALPPPQAAGLLTRARSPGRNGRDRSSLLLHPGSGCFGKSSRATLLNLSRVAPRATPVLGSDPTTASRHPLLYIDADLPALSRVAPR